MVETAAVMPTRATPASPDDRRPALAHTTALAVRALRLSLRQIDGLMTALALPVILMLMFVYLFGGAIHTGGHYVDYVVPGVLLICVGFGSATTAVTVGHDLAGGIVDRFRSMDVSARTLISGHVVASVTRNLASEIVVFAVALAIGFRSPAGVGHWLAALAVLTLFVIGLSWLAAAVGIVVRPPEGASGVMFLVSFLPYPSSAFVPISTMPGWLRPLARNQPATQVIDTLRSLLDRGPVATHLWPAVIWSLAIAGVSAVACGALFARRTR